MKVTFIVPPSFDGKQPAERSAGCTRVVYPIPNIYELTVAAVIKDLHFTQVSYKDFVNHKSNINSFTNFLKKDDSNIYIFWTVNLSIPTDIKAFNFIRNINHLKHTKIIVMGPGATYFSHKLLIDKNIIVVRGEPEITVKQLIETLYLNKEINLEKIKGISYLNSTGEIIHNPSQDLIKDLDSLPFPARNLITKTKYHNPKLKVTPYTAMVTSRNCPYQCIYCVPSSLTFAREIEYKKFFNKKPPVSLRSIENIEKEIEELAKEGYKGIGFMDDNFIWNISRTKAIAEILKKNNIVWGCQARVDAITEPIAKILADSNCRYIDLGVESFNDEILKYIKKGINSEIIRNAILLLKKYKIPIKLNILIGCSPLETKDTIKQTFKEIKKLKVDQVMFNIVSPFPGTEFYEICKKNNWLKYGEYRATDVQRESILNLPYLSFKEMENLLFKNNLKYFLSPYFIFRQLKRYRSFGEFIHSIKALKYKLFG